MGFKYVLDVYEVVVFLSRMSISSVKYSRLLLDLIKQLSGYGELVVRLKLSLRLCDDVWYSCTQKSRIT